MEKVMDCYLDGHHDPDELVVIGETVRAQVVEEGKKKVIERRTERVVRYAEWEYRCRTCFPRKVS